MRIPLFCFANISKSRPVKLSVFSWCTITLIGLVVFVSNLAAQTDIFVRGAGRLYPIALPQLCLESGQSGSVREIPEVLARNLDLSGFFEVLNPMPISRLRVAAMQGMVLHTLTGQL
jgi:hypothetical protein